MGRTKDDIKKSVNVATEKVTILADELDRILALKTLFKSEGGAILIKYLQDNCLRALLKAMAGAKKGDNITPFVLDYAANLELLSNVQDLSLEQAIRDQLDEAVKEELI